MSTIFEAVTNGDSVRIHELLVNGEEINRRNVVGRTALHIAAVMGHLSCALQLLALDADLSRKDNYGYTPLHCAAISGNLRCLKEFLDRGADFRSMDRNGWTPLNFSARYGHATCVRELVARGADVKKATIYGWTPLHQSAFSGHLNCVKALCESWSKEKLLLVMQTIYEATGLPELPCSVIALMIRPQPAIFFDGCRVERPIDLARKVEHHDIVAFLQKHETL